MSKYYVYTWTYPDGYIDDDGTNLSGIIFYVGKGSRDRIDNHEARAIEFSRPQTPISTIIRQVWRAGGKPLKQKVAFFDDEKEAYAYEMQLIKSLRGTGYLVNEKHNEARRKERLPQVFHLHKDRARELAILTSHKQALRSDITEQEVLEELIHNAWYDLDQYYQEKAAEAL